MAATTSWPGTTATRRRRRPRGPSWRARDAAVTVCGGDVSTETGLDALLVAAAERRGRLDVFVADAAGTRFASLGEIVGVVAFPASADASFVTGATVMADGGLANRFLQGRTGW